MTATPPADRTGRPRVRLTSAERRESILAAATEVFAGAGYRRGKVSAIAARLGVSEPVVFQNFGSKAALYETVLTRAVTSLCGALVEQVRRGTPVPELLATLLDPGHMERFHAPGSLGFLFADATSLIAEPSVEDAARSALRQLAEAFADLLRHGQRNGGIRTDLDPVAASWWLMSIISARTFRAAVTPDRTVLEAAIADMTLETLSAAPESSAEPR